MWQQHGVDDLGAGGACKLHGYVGQIQGCVAFFFWEIYSGTDLVLSKREVGRARRAILIRRLATPKGYRTDTYTL
jgi:hypothetical protein